MIKKLIAMSLLAMVGTFVLTSCGTTSTTTTSTTTSTDRTKSSMYAR